MGEISRFRSVKQAISYCGLCSDEKSSADKVMRTPLSKQRNKHIQRVLVEAAKLAPKLDHDLAAVYERAKQKGNALSCRSRRTRLRSLRRSQAQGSLNRAAMREKEQDQQRAGCQVPHVADWATESDLHL
jgi:hypothetical protein